VDRILTMNLLTSVPAWATSEEAQVWLLGFGAGAMVTLFRACLRWMKRAMDDRGAMGD
jgi:hypothetical protein